MKFKDALDSVKREIAIMKKLIHPNVIQLYEVIENPDNDKLYMSKNIANIIQDIYLIHAYVAFTE